MASSQPIKKKGLSDLESMTKLGNDYCPSEFDVICARGKGPKNHIGNQRFRQKIEESTPAYANARSRLQKTLLVTTIVQWVRDASPNGGFVKDIDGMWYEVGDHLAREKVGQSLREQLHSQYKSSAKSKRARKKQEEYQIALKVKQTYNFLDSMVKSNPNINEGLQNVQEQAGTLVGPAASDDNLLRLFEDNNTNILKTISSDVSMQQGISQLTSFGR